jgi:hypothetical protein
MTVRIIKFVPATARVNLLRNCPTERHLTPITSKTVLPESKGHENQVIGSLQFANALSSISIFVDHPDNGDVVKSREYDKYSLVDDVFIGLLPDYFTQTS